MISLYNEQNVMRRMEYTYCLHRNLSMDSFDKIVVFYDTSKGLDDVWWHTIIHHSPFGEKLELVEVNGRATYEDFFKLANEKFFGEIVVVANADIFFDATIELAHNIDFYNKFVVLTRYNYINSRQIELFFAAEGKTGSADTWIFQAPIRDFPSNFKLGTCRCDGRISFEAECAGFKVVNPCLDIKTYHLHNTGKVNDERYSTEYESGGFHDFPFCSIQEAA